MSNTKGYRKASPRTNYVGVKFNRLTGVRYIKCGLWEWQCECGNLRLAKSYDVKTGRVRQCRACSKRKTPMPDAVNPLIGQTFGRLTVVSSIASDVYNCRCACGMPTVLRYPDLTTAYECTYCKAVAHFNKLKNR